MANFTQNVNVCCILDPAGYLGIHSVVRNTSLVSVERPPLFVSGAIREGMLGKQTYLILLFQDGLGQPSIKLIDHKNMNLLFFPVK